MCGVLGVKFLTWAWVIIYIMLLINQRFTKVRPIKDVMSLVISLLTLLHVWWI